jgi:hypothetical protein
MEIPQSKKSRILPHLWRGALLLVLLFALIEVMPIAFGQRNLGRTSANANEKLKAPANPAGVCSLAWQAAANMPTDFYGGAAASNGTFAYVAGGFSFSTGQSLSSLYRYDPVGNAWTTLTPAPAPGFIMAVAVYYPTTNKIYVFGGEDAMSGTNYNTTRIYNIASGTWSTGANMPDVRSFMAGAYNPGDGNIYILSGYNTGDVTSAQPNTWRYNPATDTWTDLTGTAPYPHPAGGFAYGVINNHIYVAGGRDAANMLINLTYDFNPATLTYTQKANEPGTNNNVPGSGVALNHLWVFGGGNPFSSPGGASSVAAFAKQLAQLAPNVKVNAPATTNSTLVYDPVADSWLTTGANMTSLRSFPGGTNIGNKLVAAGGYNGSSSTASAETLNVTCIPTPSPTPCPGDQYTITAGADTIVAGTTDTGNHCDDCDTAVAIPFPFQLYGNTYNSVNVDSNGRLDFVTPNEPGGYNTACLPAPPNIGPFDYTIFPLWEDFQTNTGLSGCTTWANGCGIFTSVSGTAPNRVFNIEWHAVLFANNASAHNFEARLYENDPQKKFEIVFGTLNTTGADENYVSGVQGASGFFTQDFCSTTPLQNTARIYTSPGCGPTVTSAVSRKTCGATNFDIPLPLTCPSGVECRTGPYLVVAHFDQTVTTSPTATIECAMPSGGTTGAVTVSGQDVMVVVSGTPSAQDIRIRIDGVNGSNGFRIPMGILVGDINGNGSVTAADISADKACSGNQLDQTNFRCDVNASCSLTAADISLTKSRSGQASISRCCTP